MVDWVNTTAAISGPPLISPGVPGQSSDSFVRLTQRLSAASVRRRWEAYRDIDWDDPQHELSRHDVCWEFPAWDPLAASEWYRDQPEEQRAAIGLSRAVAFLKTGIEFEGVLCEGLLKFTSTLRNGDPAFRYAYHEITEEAQHSMMFQEFINRSGFHPPASPAAIQRSYRRIAGFGDAQPVLFFLAVLTGEEALDKVQRRMLADPSTHRLLHRISEIHVAEEARHLSFARGFLRDVTPRLDARWVRYVSYQAPFVVRWMADRIFGVPDWLVEEWAIPNAVISAISDGVEAKGIRSHAMAGVVSFCREIGLVGPGADAMWSTLVTSCEDRIAVRDHHGLGAILTVDHEDFVPRP